MGNIGNMNADAIYLPSFQGGVGGRLRLKRNRIVEVFGVGGIDGKSERIAHVASAKNLIGYFVSG